VWPEQLLHMKAVDQPVEATTIEDTTVAVPVPEVDGTRATTTGETLQATEMDGDPVIVDVADD